MSSLVKDNAGVVTEEDVGHIFQRGRREGGILHVVILLLPSRVYANKLVARAPAPTSRAPCHAWSVLTTAAFCVIQGKPGGFFELPAIARKVTHTDSALKPVLRCDGLSSDIGLHRADPLQSHQRLCTRIFFKHRPTYLQGEMGAVLFVCLQPVSSDFTGLPGCRVHLRTILVGVVTKLPYEYCRLQCASHSYVGAACHPNQE